jgi:hypothetical protein
VDPTPGIATLGLGRQQQLFGPADYKIWATSTISAESVGRGWSVPVRLIPDQLLTRVNELADVLGYVPVGADWGTGARPANLVVRDAPCPIQPDGGTPPPWARGLGDRLTAGLARRNQHGRRADESLLLYVALLALARHLVDVPWALLRDNRVYSPVPSSQVIATAAWHGH